MKIVYGSNFSPNDPKDIFSLESTRHILHDMEKKSQSNVLSCKAEAKTDRFSCRNDDDEDDSSGSFKGDYNINLLQDQNIAGQSISSNNENPNVQYSDRDGRRSALLIAAHVYVHNENDASIAPHWTIGPEPTESYVFDFSSKLSYPSLNNMCDS